MATGVADKEQLLKLSLKPSRSFETSKLSTHNDSIVIERQHNNDFLEITFRRNIRVPNGAATSDLPVEFGNLSLFPVDQFAEKLPASIVTKGGVLMPMYSREAFWIALMSLDSFAVKVFDEYTNAISGEPAIEDVSSKRRQLKLLKDGGSVQDYVVTPDQFAIKGIASEPGKVRQFAGAPTSAEYPVEAETISVEGIKSLRFQITPTKAKGKTDAGQKSSDKDLTELQVLTLTGRTIPVSISLKSTVFELKTAFHEIEGIPVSQMRMIWDSQELCNEFPLYKYGIEKDSQIYFVFKMPGRANLPGRDSSTLSVSADGLIEHSIFPDKHVEKSLEWDGTKTVEFNVHMINASIFRQVLGGDIPETSLTAEIYNAFELPFFKAYDEQEIEIASRFKDIKLNATTEPKTKKGADTEEVEAAPEVIAVPTTPPSTNMFRSVEDHIEELRSHEKDDSEENK